MLNLDRVHFVIDEMISSGRIVESNRLRILSPLHVMDEAVKKWPRCVMSRQDEAMKKD